MFGYKNKFDPILWEGSSCDNEDREDSFQGGGAIGDFSKSFVGVAEVVKFVSSHSKLRKQP